MDKFTSINGEEYYTNLVIEWIYRMGKKFGGTVHIKDERSLDWGQALCRVKYGKDWSEYMNNHDIVNPNEEDIKICKELEDGKFPDYFEITPLNREE